LTHWAGVAFGEFTWVAGWALLGAVLGGATGFAVWWAITPPDAPHGGGLLIPGVVAFGGLIGGVVGLAAGIVDVVRRSRRGDPPHKVGLF
jgi:hypothetical protein